MFSLIKKFAGLFGFSQEAKTENDFEVVIKNPTTANIDTVAVDLEAEVEKFFPNIPVPIVEATGAILEGAAPLAESRSTTNIEVFVATAIHNLPAFGIKDQPLDDATKQALASCNSTLDAWSIVTQALLKVEGIQ